MPHIVRNDSTIHMKSDPRKRREGGRRRLRDWLGKQTLQLMIEVEICIVQNFVNISYDILSFVFSPKLKALELASFFRGHYWALVSKISSSIESEKTDKILQKMNVQYHEIKAIAISLHRMQTNLQAYM